MSEAKRLSVEVAEAVAEALLAEARRKRQERRETVAMIRRCLVGRYYPSPWLFHAGSALDGTLGAVTNNSGIGAPGHAQRWNDGPVDGTPLRWGWMQDAGNTYGASGWLAASEYTRDPYSDPFSPYHWAFNALSWASTSTSTGGWHSSYDWQHSSSCSFPL